jgi:hypothetical protein
VDVQGTTGSDLASITDAALQQAGVKSRLLRKQLLNRRDELMLEAEGDEPEVETLSQGRHRMSCPRPSAS